MGENPEDVREFRHMAWLDATERELQQGLRRNRAHIRGLDPARHGLAAEVAEGLARCGLWLGESQRPGGGGVDVRLPGADITEEVYVGWSAPEASVGAAFEQRAYQVMLDALAELLELMGFQVDRHSLPARGIKGLVVTRREEDQR